MFYLGDESSCTQKERDKAQRHIIKKQNCKEKDDLCEKTRVFEMVQLYRATCLLVTFKDFLNGQIVMGDLPR